MKLVSGCSSAGEPVARIETSRRSGQTSRVLVVDDNVDAADMLVMMLQMFAREVKAAYSGQAALETAVEYQPDFVLLDIGLPDMNGYEVAQHLRRQQRTKNVSLIAITGYGQDSDRKRSEEAGIDIHLVKPVDPKKLKTCWRPGPSGSVPGNRILNVSLPVWGLVYARSWPCCAVLQ